MEVEDEDALATMYGHVIATFPDAILEDPHDLPAVREAIAPHADRVSYDAPITQVDDLDDDAGQPDRAVNVKPCRTGSLRRAARALRALRGRRASRCTAAGWASSASRAARSSCSASLFHPDGPNDVAPSSFNGPDPPEGLPTSPLPPRPEATGFRRASVA